ncbi:MAG: hypothetical protein AB8C84_12795 [Oligoflexales bacterium]
MKLHNRIYLGTVLSCLFLNSTSWASSSYQIPVVVSARELILDRALPSNHYALFRNQNGIPQQIPHQIDERDRFGDFILPENKKDSDGVFGGDDELSFMGHDMGPSQQPQWESITQKNPVLGSYEIKTQKGKTSYSAFLVAFKKPFPYKLSQRYTFFSDKQSRVETQTYNYQFNPENYLMAQSVDIHSTPCTSKKPCLKKVIDQSSFHLDTRFKYLFNLEFDGDDVNTTLLGFKNGPIRSIIRIAIGINFLKLQFDLDMYTDISFFANAVTLPALIDYPFDSTELLEDGSHISYTLQSTLPLEKLNLKSNLPHWPTNSLPRNKVWSLSSHNDFFKFYMEVTPSKKMIEDELFPQIKTSDINSKANVSVLFDLAKFKAKSYNLSFRLLFEKDGVESLTDFQKLHLWSTRIQRVYAK